MGNARDWRRQPAILTDRIDQEAACPVEAAMGGDASEAWLPVDGPQARYRHVAPTGANGALRPAEHLAVGIDKASVGAKRQIGRVVDASRLAQERCRAALLVKGVGVEPLAARIGEIGGAAIEPAEQEPFAANQGIREFKLWGS